MEEAEKEVGTWEGTPAPLSLCLPTKRQLPVTVAWAMAGGLLGMLGASILLLDPWMEQKGVDGFSLSVSSFHIQQIRAEGCCGDNTAEGSGTPAPQMGARQRGLELSRGSFLCCGKHNNKNNNNRKRKGRERELEEGERKRKGGEDENTSGVQAMAVLLFKKRRKEGTRLRDGSPRLRAPAQIALWGC